MFTLKFLDISEADLIYTETLMQRGKENYTGKEIVILGGGDGGLLWELLKEKPKFVTMLEVCQVILLLYTNYYIQIIILYYIIMIFINKLIKNFSFLD